MLFSSFLTPLQLPTPNNKTKQNKTKQSKMKQTVHRNTTEFVWCWPTTPGCGAPPECVDTPSEIPLAKTEFFSEFHTFLVTDYS